MRHELSSCGSCADPCQLPSASSMSEKPDHKKTFTTILDPVLITNARKQSRVA